MFFQHSASANLIYKNRSMVGDNLVSTVTGTLYAGNNSCLEGCEIVPYLTGLTHAYLEQTIPYSQTGQFNLQVTQLTITIGGITATTTNLVTISNIVKNGGVVPADEFFYDLSENNLQLNFPIDFNGFQWVNNTSNTITIETKFHVSSNYALDVADFEHDNRFRSEVTNVMYLTAMDLSTGPYNGSQLYPSPGNGIDPCTGVSPICTCYADPVNQFIFLCETGSGLHYFYPLKYKSSLYAATIDNTNRRCNQRLSLITKLGIAGETVNPFPFEYRAVPQVEYDITMPASTVGNYLEGGDAEVFTVIHRYNEPFCPFYEQISNRVEFIPNPLSLSAYTPDGTLSLALMPTYYNWDFTASNSVVCNGQWQNATQIPLGDENTEMSISIPFDWNNCPAETLNIGSTTVETFLNPGTPDEIAFDASVSPAYSFILPSVSEMTPVAIGTVHVTTNVAEWDVELIGLLSTMSAENAFIYVPEFCNGNIDFANVTVTLNGVPVTAITHFPGFGVRVELGTLVVPYDNIYHFSAPVLGCNTFGTCSTLVYTGYRCSGYPDYTSIPFICENNPAAPSDQNIILNVQFDPINITASLDPGYSSIWNRCVEQSFDVIIHSGDAGGSSHFEITLNFTTADPATDLLFDETNCTLTSSAACGAIAFTPVTISNNGNGGYTLAYDLLDGGQDYFLQLGCDLNFHFTINPQCTYVQGIESTPFTVSVAYAPYCEETNLTTLNGTLSTSGWQYGDDLCPCIGALAVSIDPVPALCTGGCATLTATATGGSGIYTYSWNGGSTSASYSECNSVPGTNTYTVTVDDGSGNATASVNVFVVNNQGFDCCIPENFNPVTEFDFSNKNVAQVLADYPGVFTWSTTYACSLISTTSTILINGIFTVEQDFAFLNCSTVVMGPAANIHVLPGITLNTINSSFSACSDMWQHIAMSDGSTLNSDNSTFKDALGAVSANGGNVTLDIQSSTFDLNLVDVEVAAGSGYVISLQDNDFICNGTLKAPYLGSRTNMHLYFDDVTSIINIGNAIGNTFDNADYGIYALRSNVSANNNTFTNFMPYQNVGGIAAFGYECRQFDFGFSYTPNIFTTCIYGVQTKNSNCNILYNNFANVEVAVNTLSSMGRVINIEYNFMTNVTTGVMSAGNMQSTVNINNNDITTRAPQQGNTSQAIYFGTMGGGYQSNIFENVIQSLSTYGIQVEGAGSAKVENNTINLLHPTDVLPLKYGIRADGCPKILLNHNCVSQPSGTINHTLSRGITLADCFYALVKCNNTFQTEWGIQFIGACDGSLTRGNTFGRHDKSLVLGNDAPPVTGVIDNQIEFTLDGGFTYYVVGNIYDQYVWDTYTYDVSTAPFYYYSSTGNLEDYPVSYSSAGGSVPIVPQSSLLNYYTDCPSCSANTLDGENPGEDVGVSAAERVAQAAMGNTEEGDNVWKAKKSLYESLSTDSAVLDSSTIVETFQDTTETDAIGKLAETAQAIAAIADSTIQDDSTQIAARINIAQIKNAAVVTQLTPEENEKAVNDIYLNSFAQGRYELTAAEISQLTSIANQCPYTGGYAVYAARNILRSINPFVTFNDEQACSGYSSRKAKAMQKSMKMQNALRVYPNPTTGILTIEYRDKISATLILKLQNTLGNEVRLEELRLSEGSAQYDISTMPPAVYFYKAYIGGAYIATGKVVLIK